LRLKRKILRLRISLGAMRLDMSYLVFEADIHCGHITVKEPEKLPEQARGLLIVLPDPPLNETTIRPRSRVQLPLIRGNGQQTINPTPEELDGSLWDEPRS
jgi:hypothetical protein